MPKASQSPSKTKKCQLCRLSFRTQNLPAHIKKCERERREHQGEIKYVKTRERRLRTLEASYDEFSAPGVAIPDEPQTYDFIAADPMDFDAGFETSVREQTPPPVTITTGPSARPAKFAIEYHPNSGRAPQGPGDHSCKCKRLSLPKAEPWRPFFKTHKDFLFSEVLMEAGMNKDRTDRLIEVVRLCIEGKGTLTFSNYLDIRGAWERASLQVTAFNFCDISVPYNGVDRTFEVPHRPLWDWAVDLIMDPQLDQYFEWDAQKVFKHDGENISRVYDEPWTADSFWNFQSGIPKGVHPLCFILYADKLKLSSFGTEKAYPVIARCTNLPAEIWNCNSGVGGGRIVRWLPDIPETAEGSGKTGFTNFKRKVWHHAFHCIIESIVDKSKAGYWLQCVDGTQQQFFPGIITLSADYEEQCVMSLIWGAHGKMPCPICFVPDDQLADISNTWPLRTTEWIRELIEEGRTLDKSVDREYHFSRYGIHDVDNVFWHVNNSDPYRALSFDRLHANNNGIFRNHLWKRFKGLFKDTIIGRAAATKLEHQFNLTPRWCGLNHFSEVMHVDFTDGGKNEDISKVVVFAAHNIFPPDKDKEEWKLLLCLRSFSILDLLLSLEVHTEEMILAGQSELERFGTLMKEYAKLCVTLEEDLQSKTTAKNWNFPKMHALVHGFDDIKAKGASRNYNTKPNEKMHGFLRKLYLNRTNFKRVASQILKYEHISLVAALIRKQIDELNAAKRELVTNEDDIGCDTLGSTQEQHIGSSVEPPVQDGHHVEGEGRRSMPGLLFCDRDSLLSYLGLLKPGGFKIGLSGTSVFAPGCMRVEFQAEDKITEYRSMKVCYESMVNWQQYLDYLYCSPQFHGLERRDFVILKTTNGFISAELLFIFTTSVAEYTFPICLVHPLDAASQPRSKDVDLRLRRLRSKSSTEFFFAQSIVRGVPLIRTFDNMSGDYFVMDVVDHSGNLFFHCNEIFIFHLIPFDLFPS
ncbi:hypothetical protein H4582DRAFT_2071883 [Lactarius indigo]|nr:hypothetical protein H4582DRAFT_2071883 [Lactarius indigo]